jgi:hypothetical protein
MLEMPREGNDMGRNWKHLPPHVCAELRNIEQIEITSLDHPDHSVRGAAISLGIQLDKLVGCIETPLPSGGVAALAGAMNRVLIWRDTLESRLEYGNE